MEVDYVPLCYHVAKRSFGNRKTSRDEVKARAKAFGREAIAINFMLLAAGVPFLSAGASFGMIAGITIIPVMRKQMHKNGVGMLRGSIALRNTQLACFGFFLCMGATIEARHFLAAPGKPAITQHVPHRSFAQTPPRAARNILPAIPA